MLKLKNIILSTFILIQAGLNLHAQQAFPDNYSILKNNATVFDVRLNDTYSNTDYITIPFQSDSGVTFFPPQHGQIFYLNNYSIMYVPDSGFVGNDNFVYGIAYFDKYYFAIDTARVFITIVAPDTIHCEASFTFDINPANHQVSFHGTNLQPLPGNPTTYHWTFSDNTTSAAMNPNHIFAAANNNACLTIETAQGCSNTFCDSIVFPPNVIVPDSCNADFSFSIPINNSVAFSDQSTGIITNWAWSFGDNTNNTIKDPMHLYNAAGNFHACLTITTDRACTSTICKDIQIVQPLLDTVVIFGGYVWAGDNKLPKGVAVLFDADQHYKAVDWNYVQDGLWLFSAPAGNYLVYIIPDYNYQLSWNKMYFPTYLGDKLFWQNASIFNINSEETDLDIHLRSSSNLSQYYGSGAIHGDVSYTCDSTYEQNIFNVDWFNDTCSLTNNASKTNTAMNMPVFLLNENGIPIKFMLSRRSGSFDFNNIANRNYQVHTEKAGMLTVPVNLSLNEQHPEFSNISIFVGSTNITSGICNQSNNTNIQGFNIYPVPVTDVLHINVELEKSELLTVTITDICGKIIHNNTANLYQGKNHTEIDTRTFEHGVYFINFLNSNGKSFTTRFVK